MDKEKLMPGGYIVEREFLSRISVQELISRIVRNQVKGIQEASRQAQIKARDEKG